MPAEKGTTKYRLEVKEIFSGNRTAAELFAELILTEQRNVTKKLWTDTQSQAIMKLSTVKS